MSLPWDGEWKAEDRGIEFLNDAAAARAGRRDFELRRRLRRARAARLRAVEGMQTSCMLADVVVVLIEGWFDDSTLELMKVDLIAQLEC